MCGLAALALLLVSGALANKNVSICTNTCATANNSICEDGGPTSVGTALDNLRLCDYGTDCADCGVRSEPPTHTPTHAPTETCHACF